MHISKSKIQNACLVNYCHLALLKSGFFKYEGLSHFHIGPWNYNAKNANVDIMLLSLIFSIILKLPLFLFWNFTKISKEKKNTVMYEKNFSTLYAPSSSIARSLKEKLHSAGSNGSFFFSFPPTSNQPNRLQKSKSIKCAIFNSNINPLLLWASSSSSTASFFFSLFFFFFLFFVYNIFLSSCLLGDEEELSFGWRRITEEEIRWWVEEMKRYLMGMEKK